MNGYTLSRDWFDFCFENPELISVGHTAIYFFALDIRNRSGQKEKFGFASYNTMEVLGIKNHRTYKRYFDDLVKRGFIQLIQESKNQYTACVIALVKNTKAHTKALDKAHTKHIQKHIQKHCTSTATVIEQKNNRTKEQENKGTNEYISLHDIESKLLIPKDNFDYEITTKKDIARANNDTVIQEIKKNCDELGFVYDRKDDRMFANFFTKGPFQDFCQKHQIETLSMIKYIMIASKNHRKGPASGPKSIYQNYPDIINKYQQNKEKNKENQQGEFLVV